MSFTARITALNLKPTETVAYQLPISLDGKHKVVLVIKYAGESNKHFQNALRRATATLRVGSEDAQRQMMIELFAQHVIIGWEHVVDDTGAVVPFSPAKCEELLAEVVEQGAQDYVAGLFNYAYNADNFRGAPQLAAGDLGNG